MRERVRERMLHELSGRSVRLDATTTRRSVANDSRVVLGRLDLNLGKGSQRDGLTVECSAV